MKNMGGYGSDMADSGKIDFEEAVDGEYKSSSNKNDDQSVTYDDNEYENNQPFLKRPPKTPIPRPKQGQQRYNYGPKQSPNTVPVSSAFHFQAPEVQYDSRSPQSAQYPQYKPQQQPNYQPINFRQQQPPGQLLSFSIPLSINGYKNQNDQMQQSISNDYKSNEIMSQIIQPTVQSLPNPQPFYSQPQNERSYDFTGNSPDNNNNYALSDRQVFDLMQSNQKSSSFDSNLHVLSDDSREPNIIFEKTGPPVISSSSFFGDQYRDASTKDSSHSEVADPTDKSEESPKAFFRDSRDGIIFEELPKNPKKKKKELMLYQDQTDAPVYVEPEKESGETQIETLTQNPENNEYYSDNGSGIIFERRSSRGKRKTVSECIQKEEWHFFEAFLQLYSSMQNMTQHSKTTCHQIE